MMNPLQHSCLGNPMDRGAGGYSPQGHKRVRYNLMTKQQQQSLQSGQNELFLAVPRNFLHELCVLWNLKHLCLPPLCLSQCRIPVSSLEFHYSITEKIAQERPSTIFSFCHQTLYPFG